MAQATEIEISKATSENVNALLRDSINENELILFIKGTADFPQCGFSARVGANNEVF